MKLNNLGYLLKEGFRGIFLHGFMSFAAVCVTVACLVIVGSFSILAYNLDIMVEELNKTSEILVYIDTDLSDAKTTPLTLKPSPSSTLSLPPFAVKIPPFAEIPPFSFLLQILPQLVHTAIQRPILPHVLPLLTQIADITKPRCPPRAKSITPAAIPRLAKIPATTFKTKTTTFFPLPVSESASFLIALLVPIHACPANPGPFLFLAHND